MLLRIGQHSGILSTSASDTKLAELEVRYERGADIEWWSQGSYATLNITTQSRFRSEPYSPPNARHDSKNNGGRRQANE